MRTTLTPESTREITARLHAANTDFAARYPGESWSRQPVHTVYGGAHLFKSDTRNDSAHSQCARSNNTRPTSLLFARALKLPGADELPLRRSRRSCVARRNSKQDGERVRAAITGGGSRTPFTRGSSRNYGAKPSRISA